MNDYELQMLGLFNRIANALEAIALTNAPAPNFVKPIESYASFDFTAIGALVKGHDANGPTELEWGGYLWTRRSPQNKFGEAIWFSRATGKDAEGNVKYSRLITFKKLTEAEPLPRKVEALVENAKPVMPVKQAAPVESTRSEIDEYFGPNPRTDGAGPRTAKPDDLTDPAITWKVAFESLHLDKWKADALLRSAKNNYEAAYKIASQAYA